MYASSFEMAIFRPDIVVIEMGGERKQMSFASWHALTMDHTSIFSRFRDADVFTKEQSGKTYRYVSIDRWNDLNFRVEEAICSGFSGGEESFNHLTTAIMQLSSAMAQPELASVNLMIFIFERQLRKFFAEEAKTIADEHGIKVVKKIIELFGGDHDEGQ